MLGPVLDALSEDYGEKADFVKVNVDDNPDIAEEYGIMSIPCVMVFKNGELSGKNVGFVPKETMREFIDKISEPGKAAPKNFGARPFLTGAQRKWKAGRSNRLKKSENYAMIKPN